MSSDDVCYDSSSLLKKKTETENGEEEEQAEGKDNCRKPWRTLDAPSVDRDDNLYVAVRQSLHKVNRVSENSLSPLRNAETGNRSGVSQESSMGRFSTIKAYFDMGQEEGSRYTCRTTIMGKLKRMLELRKREASSMESTMNGLKKDVNGNIISD
ncbi:uncharacterized protein LOC117162689 [Bombus vancouverensis nearcticus]|uniref:Uncharacterized protein LOC117207349 n=1 Tax=Bombus bifarius TaxID=103933 RepID=A0A6P8MMK0_9HYME|nr:uncharacterized protein LOC117162689 [Bombus vancouverensis nearcticus]XP_033303357.1 uncharacterized protein LOC117207349 [Bombus bifarius]